MDLQQIPDIYDYHDHLEKLEYRDYPAPIIQLFSVREERRGIFNAAVRMDNIKNKKRYNNVNVPRSRPIAR